MSKFVLDASAILALMFLERGKDRVEETLDDALVSRVNITEVLTKLIERGSSLEDACENVSELDIGIIEFDEIQSKKVAELRSFTKHLGLSLGDRACLALTILESATAITADKSWSKLDLCSIEVIR